ncbi:hypothetical protein MPER_06299, partial [Moniliophthora perniciosa FA553]
MYQYTNIMKPQAYFCWNVVVGGVMLQTVAGVPHVTYPPSNRRVSYNVLAYLPEVLSTKTTLARYFKKHIFDPLGMKATTYSFDVANASGNLADGIARENHTLATGLPGTGTPRTTPFWYKDGGEDGNVMSGSCGVISSANDLAIWLQTLLLGGKHPQTSEQVIPTEVLETLSTGLISTFPCTVEDKRCSLTEVD